MTPHPPEPHPCQLPWTHAECLVASASATHNNGRTGQESGAAGKASRKPVDYSGSSWRLAISAGILAGNFQKARTSMCCVPVPRNTLSTGHTQKIRLQQVQRGRILHLAFGERTSVKRRPPTRHQPKRTFNIEFEIHLVQSSALVFHPSMAKSLQFQSQNNNINKAH